MTDASELEDLQRIAEKAVAAFNESHDTSTPDPGQALADEILRWASTPGNHGGNPYAHRFVTMAQEMMWDQLERAGTYLEETLGFMLRITINLENDATQDCEEIRRIIHKAATELTDVIGIGYPSENLRDINGNTVGKIEIVRN
jgi:hypothetical protein